jgi:cellulose synthase/poly-beta-1,6-N-acetylglucosamine synthase-like glycosyltransferase
MAQAKGEWIAFLDADDCWFPRRLEAQMAAAERYPEVALWCGESVRFEGEAGDVLATSVPRADSREIPLMELAERNPIATSTVLVRKAVLENAGGFDPQFRGPEDYDLWLRVAARARLRFLACPLAAYRYQPGSLSTDDRRFLRQVVGVLRKAYGIGGALHGRPGFRRAVCYHYLACAWMAAGRGARAAALRLWAESFLIWPAPCSGPYYSMPWARTRLLWFMLKRGAGKGSRQGM